MKTKRCPAPDGSIYGWIIYCPACMAAYNDAYHIFHASHWQFNGDYQVPSFTPSLKSTSEYGKQRVLRCCHIVVEGGKIRYQGDCTHAMRGQTIDMVDVPDGLGGVDDSP